MKSTACGPSYDYSGNENFVKLKDCTREARACLTSLVVVVVVFSRKKKKKTSISVISFFNLQCKLVITLFCKKHKQLIHKGHVDR